MPALTGGLAKLIVLLFGSAPDRLPSSQMKFFCAYSSMFIIVVSCYQGLLELTQGWYSVYNL